MLYSLSKLVPTISTDGLAVAADIRLKLAFSLSTRRAPADAAVPGLKVESFALPCRERLIIVVELDKDIVRIRALGVDKDFKEARLGILLAVFVRLLVVLNFGVDGVLCSEAVGEGADGLVVVARLSNVLSVMVLLCALLFEGTAVK